MTYVSRKTRIIVSRWSDECDAENTLRACRKRSDGRLKKHSSCEDLRAWVNDNCIKHEHLVDLMSDGEFLGKPPFRLFGRLVPVPILFKLAQSAKALDDEVKTRETKNSAEDSNNKDEQTNLLDSGITSKDSKLENDVSLTVVQWEKNLLENSLFDCTLILNRAIKKLEKIDCVVTLANDETEKAGHEEINKSFNKSKLSCTCTCTKRRSSSLLSSSNNTSDSLSSSKSYLKKLKDSVRCTELRRKISGLKEKLKKIQDCRQEIVQQIRNSHQKADKRSSSLQVTELYSRHKEAKKLEKLIAEKGKLLLEMCQALTRLNSIKKMSKSNVGPRRNSRSNTFCEEFRNERLREPEICHCGCRCSDNCDTTDSEKLQCSESSSVDSDLNKCFEKLKQTNNNYPYNNGINSAEFSFKSAVESKNSDSEQRYGDKPNPAEQAKVVRTNLTFTKPDSATSSKQDRNMQEQKKTEKLEKSNQKEPTKPENKSKVKFICKEPPCRKILNSDDLSTFENALSPKQQAIILGAVKNVPNIHTPRPSTTPTTKRERQAVTLDQDANRSFPGENPEAFDSSVPERRVKSETTMKEIEKTLRNYEQRLADLNSLEYKIEVLIQKSLEASRMKQKLAKMKAQVKEQRAAEKEKSNREITRLCSENWELKKQILQLTAKFEAQCKKMQSLKCSAMKARELECEAEELKKELSEYRNNFEHQRKCISKWESVVAMQRTEIENLMNHIRNLTTMKEDAECSPYPDKRCIQRSRSYSPEKNKEKVANNRPKTQTRNYRQSSEEGEATACYCRDYRQQEVKRKSQPRGYDRGYSSSFQSNMYWCN